MMLALIFMIQLHSIGVLGIKYTSTSVYITTNSVPTYSIGPWVANPNNPAAKNKIIQFNLVPTVPTGTKTYNGLGVIGVW